MTPGAEHGTGYGPGDIVPQFDICTITHDPVHTDMPSGYHHKTLAVLDHGCLHMVFSLDRGNIDNRLLICHWRNIGGSNWRADAQ
jgi:hypothetical protein